jgi:hypothetical protein
MGTKKRTGIHELNQAQHRAWISRVVMIEERSLFSVCGKALAASQSSPRRARNAHEGRTQLTNIADTASSRGENAYEAGRGSRIAFARTPPMIKQYQ